MGCGIKSVWYLVALNAPFVEILLLHYLGFVGVLGHTTKIHLTVEAYGLSIAFEITSGEVNYNTIAPMLIEQLFESQGIIADKG